VTIGIIERELATGAALKLRSNSGLSPLYVGVLLDFIRRKNRNTVAAFSD
jgi:hypothetical protein